MTARAFNPRSNCMSRSMRAASSGGVAQRRADVDGLLSYAACDFLAVLARHVTVRKIAEKRQVGEDGRPHAALAARQCRIEGRETDAEHIVEAGDILAGDDVASGGLAHRFQQVDLRLGSRRHGRQPIRGRRATPGRSPRTLPLVSSTSIPSRTAPRLPGKSAPGISAARARGAQSRMMPRLVLVPTVSACRADRFEDAPADAEIGIGERRRGGSWRWRGTGRPACRGRRQSDEHCPASAPRFRAGKPLRRQPGCLGAKASAHEFAGAAKRCGRARDAALPARSARNASRASAIASAMLTAATDCSPDQAGMLLTSSTNRLAVRCRHDVDAGEIRADGACRGHCERRQFGSIVPRHQLRHRAPVDVGDPVGAATAHHRHGLCRRRRRCGSP